MHEIETKMDTPVTPSIGLFHADKQTVEALVPVVQLAKSGFFYCTQGEMSLVLGNRAFEIHRCFIKNDEENYIYLVLPVNMLETA